MSHVFAQAPSEVSISMVTRRIQQGLVVAYTNQDWETLIDVTNKAFQSLIDIIRDFKAYQFVHVPQHPELLETTHVTEYVGLCTRNYSWESLAQSKRLSEKLRAFIVCNNTFIQNLRLSRETINSHVFLTDGFDRPETFSKASTFTQFLVPLTIVPGMFCDNCSMPVPMSRVDTHKRSWMCPITKGQRDIQTKRLVVVDPDVAEAVRSALGDEAMLIPTRFDVAAPEWVATAIDTFNNGEGYAGMDLAEFLSKMASKNLDNQ